MTTPAQAPTRNWSVTSIYRLPRGSRARCGKCNASLALVFNLRQGNSTMNAGSECVRALTSFCEPATAMRALRDKWRTRRGYYYKSLLGVVWSIGQRKKTDGMWWVAVSQTARSVRYFYTKVYPTFADAKAAVAYMASTGGVA